MTKRAGENEFEITKSDNSGGRVVGCLYSGMLQTAPYSTIVYLETG